MSNKQRTERVKKSRGERVSAAEGAAIHTSAGRLAIRLPAGVQLFRPEAGKTYSGDIVEYTAGDGNPVKQVKKGNRYFERTYYVHNQVGPNKATVLCNARNFNEKCYCCERLADFITEHPNPDKATEQLIAEKRPKNRQLFNWWDWNEKAKGVQIFEISYAMFGQYLTNKTTAAARKGDKQKEFFYAPGKKEGYGLELSPTKKAIGANSAVEINTIEFVKRDADVPEEILDQAICLDDLVKDSKLSYKEVKKLYGDEESAEDDDEDEDTDTDDEEDDDDDEEDDDEDDSDIDDEEDDEEGSEEGDDEDEEEDDEPEVNVGDKVKFTKSGTKYRGKVIKVKGETAKVKTPDGEVVFVKMDDCTVIADEGKKKVKPKPKPDDDDEDDDDEDEAPKPKKKGKVKKKSGKFKRQDDGETDIPF